MNKSQAKLSCPVCHAPMALRPCRGRKSGKPSLMFICPQDGRHFRGFITDQKYVAGVLARLEALTSVGTAEVDSVDGVACLDLSKTIFGQANRPITGNHNDGLPT